MSAGRAGHNLVEASVAISLLASAIFVVSSLADNHSRQLSRLERVQPPSHARLELSSDEFLLVAEGATTASTAHDFEMLSLETRIHAAVRSLEVEVKLLDL